MVDHFPAAVGVREGMTLEEAMSHHAGAVVLDAISLEALLVAVETLLLRAFARPEVNGRHAGSAHLLCEAPGWPAWEHSARFKQPVGEWERASELVRHRLEADPARRPVEDVTLTLSDFTGQSVAQLTLLKDARRDQLGRPGGG